MPALSIVNRSAARVVVHRLDAKVVRICIVDRDLRGPCAAGDQPCLCTGRERDLHRGAVGEVEREAHRRG
jgi:hypothetical protein